MSYMSYVPFESHSKETKCCIPLSRTYLLAAGNKRLGKGLARAVVLQGHLHSSDSSSDWTVPSRCYIITAYYHIQCLGLRLHSVEYSPIYVSFPNADTGLPWAAGWVKHWV